jgi:hypothetical protein
MMRKKLVALSLWFSTLAFAGGAQAGEKPSPIQGKTPPKVTPKKEVAAPAAKGPFDLSRLGPVDPATTKAIAALAERCLASELSREGPSAQEVAQCNASVSAVSAQGKKGVSAILAVLGDESYKLRSFGRQRLYGVLAKLEDEKTRDVMIDGLAKIASEKLESHVRYAPDIDRTLRAMAGGGPSVAIPWGSKAVVVHDELAKVAESAAAWRAFHKANEGKTRAQITREVLVAARADKQSDDPKTAYRAITALWQHAPKEALGAVKAYRKRADLAAEVDAAFDWLEFRIDSQIEGRALPKAQP